MSSNPRISRRRRGLSLEAALRHTLSDFSSSPLSHIPITFNMTSVGGASGTGGSSSSQPSASSIICSIHSHQVPIQSTTNPAKVIKKYGIFQFKEDVMTTPWHISSPLKLTPSTHPLPKFKENLPRFSGNNTVTTNKHLVAFSNDCHNIGDNDNDTCMRLFVNSLKGKATTNFFDLSPKIISTWEELVHWFKSTHGQSKIPPEKLREYNKISYKYGETIKSFNLRFTKLYNKILELIHLKNQSAFMHYYNALLSLYHHRLEEKANKNLGFTLHTCL
jgi:hypothetical protein